MKKLFLILVFFPFTVYGQTAEELEGYVRSLAGTPRVGKAYNQAAQYIYNQCKDSKINVTYQKVGDSKNIIAWIDGNSDKFIVLGAHLDTVPRSPGADDNASGSAAILGLVKRYAKLPKPNYTIVFIWFCEEEVGLVGSRYYVRNSKINNCVFMLNFDMVGRLKGKPKMYSGGNASDHASFREAGVKVGWMFTGTHRDLHRSTDTVEKINYKGMEKVCQHAFILLKTHIKCKQIKLYRSEL